MANVFIISDQHYNHANFLTFVDDNNNLIRTGFSDVDHMNEVMIENHNNIVKDNDKVYFLGDVSISNVTKFDSIMSRLKGEKVLIKGNHDNLKLNNYAKWFKDIRSSHILDKFILSHIPIHNESFPKWCNGNIHGHLHQKIIMDNRYICACVEQPHINYTPISLENIKKIIDRRT